MQKVSGIAKLQIMLQIFQKDLKQQYHGTLDLKCSQAGWTV